MHDEHCSANSESCECDLRRELEKRIAVLEEERDALRAILKETRDEFESAAYFTGEGCYAQGAYGDVAKPLLDRVDAIIDAARAQEKSGE